MYPINDYENFEFKSPINPWNPQNKYKADFDKIKCLEIMLVPGKLLYIPAYWWYTFKFSENTSVSCLKYRTYMNNLAISPHIFMFGLQNQNVERKIAKQIDIKELDKKPDNVKTNKLTNEDVSKKSITDAEPSINNDIKNDIKNDKEHKNIPQILIPTSEPEPMPQNDLIGDNLLSSHPVNETSLVSSNTI